LHPSWVALIGLTTTCCIEYAVDMHGPSVMCKCLHLCGFVTRYNFFSDIQGKLAPEVEDQLGYSEGKAFQG
jgi:hypothetical protein